jgi:alpha-ketoglutarate-dependent taurine dioxygenase
MSYESIEVSPVTPRIGANVAGVTLAKPLSNRQVEELHQALAEHQVLFFREHATYVAMCRVVTDSNWRYWTQALQANL